MSILASMHAKPGKRFGLDRRDLFWAALVAVMLGWWMEHKRLASALGAIRNRNPMLYEALTGEEIDTNNRRLIAP